MSTPKFIAASDRSLLVQFGDAMSLEANQQALWLARELMRSSSSWSQGDGPLERKVLNLHPGYNSLLITFNPLLLTPGELEAEVLNIARDFVPAEDSSARRWEIPVCYGGEFGPDLAEVAELHGISEKEVIFLHSRVDYRVCFLGFSPGFPYLSGLPAELATPRLETPRKLVPAGSVAIGGEQTGIYPVDSPGGWRIIGQTPHQLFTPLADEPTLLRPGDTVRFVPISREHWSKRASWGRAAA